MEPVATSTVFSTTLPATLTVPAATDTAAPPTLTAALATVVATLTALPGIGVWTAEIYAMFALGHADVFAPGDLALQEGARMILALPERPRERALRAIAEAWSPWRAVAARALWAHYAREKAREGVR